MLRVRTCQRKAARLIGQWRSNSEPLPLPSIVAVHGTKLNARLPPRLQCEQQSTNMGLTIDGSASISRSRPDQHSIRFSIRVQRRLVRTMATGGWHVRACRER